MRTVRRLLAGIRALFRRDRVDRELDEELAAYLDAAIERHMEAGLSREAATRVARLELGSAAAVKQQAREATWESSLEDLWQDIRFGARLLRKSPGFTAVAVLTLALAIGANTAIFSIVNGLMLRALPVAAPEQLAMLSTNNAVTQGFPAGFNYTIWNQLRERAKPVGRALAWTVFHERLDLAQSGEADLVDGLFVSGNFFDELGVAPLLGRAFTSREDTLGSSESRVAVIGHGFWQRRFGGKTDVIGRSILVERQPVTIVGVAPPDFHGPEVGRAFDLAMPIGSAPLILNDETWGTEAGRSYLAIMLRLAPGRSLTSATELLQGMQRSVIAAAMPSRATWGENQDAQLKTHVALVRGEIGEDAFTLIPAAGGTSELRQQYSRAALTVLAIAVLVLLIACANIGNLLLARGAARQREMSMRLALGAPRRRLVQQLLVESLVLAALGAAAGLIVAFWAGDFVVAQMSTWFERVTLDVSLDWRVVTFTVLITVATALLFGAAPAYRASHLTPIAALDDSVAYSRSRLPRVTAGGGLVATQVALSLVLVITAGLFIRTFERLLTVPLGFDSDRVLVIEINASRTDPAAGARMSLYQHIASSIAVLPGVAQAAVSLTTPADRGVTLVADYIVPGSPEPAASERRTTVNYVTPGWFRTYGLSTLAGRVFDERDTVQAPPVAVANEAFARRFFPGREAVGGTIVDALRPEQQVPKTIVGIVGNVVERSFRLDHAPSLYLPMSQWAVPSPVASILRVDHISLSVRAADGSPVSLARSVAERLTAIDRRLSFTFRPLEEQIDAARHQERLIAWLSTFFGGLALLLAAIGLFGIASSTVVRRRTELGIRMALGAQRGDVVGAALRQTIAATVAGLGIGLGAAFVFTRYLEAMLFGITPLDPATFVTAVIVLALVAALATLLPASRAASIDPASVLRCE